MSNATPFRIEAGVLTALTSDLARVIQGEVRFDRASQALYSSDASNYRQVPIGVVIPKIVDDLVSTVALCAKHDVPFLARGGGTSQNGQGVNVAVVADTSKYLNRVTHLVPDEGYAIVQPGTICDTLRDEAEKHGLTFAPDPATHSRCTLGGMIANNSCGAHSVMAGKTVENVEALEILTYDGARFWVGPTSEEELRAIIASGGRRGQIYAQLLSLRDRYASLIRSKFPNIKRRVSGFNLDQLLPENGFNVARALVGSEGTCAVVLNAKVRLVKSPQHRTIVVVSFPNIFVAADAVSHFMRLTPIAIEGLDRGIIRGLQARGLKAEEISLLPEGDAWVVLEFGADTLVEAVERAEKAQEYFEREAAESPISTRAFADAASQRKIWSIRETGASAVALTIDPDKPDPIVGWEDAAVDPLRLGDYLRGFQALVDRYGYETCLYGHFGDGCVHARITFDIRTADGVAKWRNFLREAATLVVEYGGSLSGEHGDGQAKAEFLPIMFGPDLMRAMEEFKSIWDPKNRLNPGKVVRAYRADENLRMGPAYKVVSLTTQLDFKSREGDGLQRGIERCIGMGKCRSLEGSTMCPSFRATREERYSTRGRAHLLWEMLQGDVIVDGWKSEEVKEALDACLACKGCRSDCPTHTDMASYKAEFLSHYYETHVRPRQAAFMGRIGQWAPIASKFPRLMNFLTSAPVLASIGKRIAGVAPQRNLPRFATTTFRRGVAPAKRAAVSDGAKRKVILWVDTFNDNFTPEVARAAFTVLVRLGYEVIIPSEGLCCGRPLYDFGLLKKAKEQLKRVLTNLSQEIWAGLPLIGLEPGCLSVFKDELLKQLPDDLLARRLASQTHLFSEFLCTAHIDWPRVETRVLLHGHCHQKSVFGMAGDVAILKKIGANFTVLDSGCCGMAGSFGFDTKHYDLSQKIGENVLFPAIRETDSDTVVITNGFSCREQIHDGTGRRVMHIAEFVLEVLSARDVHFPQIEPVCA
ncbi:FAD-binding and (Fe-S)-binding domain-containing protein [Caballeronia grimmiae]|uniref:FAD-binding and (Fe-S)-binding domain-containing protein n=1 Tax=Caballeronia grimmiae TaxID=1071679 RepID=UPI001FD51A51|nr:FAD-binding and (Fe-S)-binding domain-containing protein [Caballeronia grimmiae]